ncbi:MAG: hypothetical protein K8U57_40355 [Planctomycetes bacterium]|nr:hypothetical protein [Planctomycetota bacterium]
MMTSAGLSNNDTLLAPVDEFRPVLRDELHDIAPADLGDWWIDLGCGD